LNLIVKGPDNFIFTDDGHWLHPLFALEDHLKSLDVDSSLLELRDKLIGRGAAVLICRMGIKKCHGSVVSRRGLSYLNKYSIECTYDTLVDRLDCQTELVLTDEMSSDDAYSELSRRAGRSPGL